MVRRKIKLVLVLLAIFAVYVFILQEYKERNKTSLVCIKNNCFSVEVADSPSERGKGLMGRTSLEAGKGMLFVFETEGEYVFWMKNTLIPLDMIWIDEGGRIVFIKESAQPCKTDLCESFGPDKKAKYVLEINGGMNEKLGIKIGDQAVLNF